MKMKRQASTMRDGRTFARYLEGTRVEYTHSRCGRTYEIDHSKGKRPLSVQATRHLTGPGGWWTKEKGGASPSAPHCEREWNAERRKESKR